MNQYSILVVDDQPENLETMVNYLNESGSDYQILKAPNGKIACTIAEKKIPDLIITDWDMPEMNGIEIIKWLKNNEDTKDIPVIMASGAMTLAENVKTALEVGALDFIKKPVEKIELIARVNSMLKLSISYKKIKSQNQQLELQKNEISKKNNQITDSILYAKRIQQALLPPEKAFSDHLSSHFIFFKPKNIVSGDFYYFKKINENLIIAAADCTGHGVPGALVSMLGISLLNEITGRMKISQANLILEELRKQVKNSLQQITYKNSQADGMDIALCVIDTKTSELQYAGAYNPLYIINNHQLTEIKATSSPIGIHLKEKPFENNKIQLQTNDKIYMFSDGYADQFGGKKNSKFMTLKFKKLLSDISEKPFDEQNKTLNETIDNWKNGRSQDDDMLVIGLKMKNEI